MSEINGCSSIYTTSETSVLNSIWTGNNVYALNWDVAGLSKIDSH